MNGRPIRVYADTSVFGGVFDPEFARPSRTFFEQVRSGRFELVTSNIVEAELEEAPAEVVLFFGTMVEIARIEKASEEAVRLQQAYVKAGIVSPKWSADALHVAVATVSQCALIVSWNFRHIVHFQKAPLYTAINTVQGYAPIAVYSPREVIEDDG